MIKITYVSKHSFKTFSRLLEGGSYKDLQAIPKVESDDYREYSRSLISDKKTFDFMYILCKGMLGGIYHIETESEIIKSLLVKAVNVTEGEIVVVGIDEEAAVRYIKASEIRFYWSRK